MVKFRTNFETNWCDLEQPYFLPTGTWRYRRPVVKLEKCRQCGWCYLLCPAGCMVEEKGYFLPDLTYCKGCGVCAVECPADAIIMILEEVE